MAYVILFIVICGIFSGNGNDKKQYNKRRKRQRSYFEDHFMYGSKQYDHFLNTGEWTNWKS